MEVARSETAELVHAGDLGLYDTIDQRFDVVREAIRSGADRYEVSYDPDTGIPVRTEYDHRIEAVDDEGWNSIRLLPSASHGEDAQ